MHTGMAITPLAGMPLFAPGMAIAPALIEAMARAGESFRDGDIVVLAQKIVSKSEGRRVVLDGVEPCAEASRIATETGRDPRAVQLIIDESSEIMRVHPMAIIARQRTGHVLANAGIDASNLEGGNLEGGGGEALLLWPLDPDASARAIRRELVGLTGARIGVVIADSMGRAWRIGTVGTAIGVAGVCVLDDRRGKDQDLFGRTLQATVIAVADAVATAAVLAMGEGAQGTPAALVRGCSQWVSADDGPGAVSGLRPADQDMFR